MTLLIASNGVQLADLEIHLDALSRYKSTNLHFVDCVVAATAFARRIAVATFDSGFKKFPDIQVDISVKPVN